MFTEKAAGACPLAILLIAAAHPVAAASDPAADRPCQALARQALSLPTTAWANGISALAPALTIHAHGTPATPLELKLANLPKVRSALGDEEGSLTAYTDHLDKTDLYSISVTAGTLECQSFAFVRADERKTPRLVDGPPVAEDDLCWTRSGAFGALYGRPVFVQYGANSQVTVDQDIKLTPWLGQAWGRGCEVDLRFKSAYERTERFCADQGVCDAADHIAVPLAAAYELARQGSGDIADFSFGVPPSPEQRQALARLSDPRTSVETTPFPTFGQKAKSAFPFYSYSGFVLFPLQLDGRPLVAALGHGGVGWRESPDVLISIYAIDNGALTPLAGLVVERSVGALSSAEAKGL